MIFNPSAFHPTSFPYLGAVPKYLAIVDVGYAEKLYCETLILLLILCANEGEIRDLERYTSATFKELLSNGIVELNGHRIVRDCLGI
ncbi:unnamed protein product [Enterobius vermicularis]|uniref:SufE domain-containing protein n=1 Tax=Enterobius vermicularis TaxID=51028 RepID=A0A0N4UYG0_ENTVE|nr:unnamed protein product [Enterobius vermicularis]